MIKKMTLRWQTFFDSRNRRILVKNFFSLGAANVILSLVSLITIPYLMRVIGPGKYGLLAFAQVFVQYFILLTDYGFNFSANREVAIHKNNPEQLNLIFNSVFAVRIIFFLTCFSVFSALVIFVPPFNQNRLVYLLSFGAVLGNILIPTFFFLGMEKMDYVLWTSLWPLPFTTLIFFYVKKEVDFLYVPLLGALGSITSGIWALVMVSVKFKIRFFLPPFKKIIHQFQAGWHVFISNAAGTCYNNSRLFMLGLFSSHAITGYYAVAERLMALVIFFPLGLFLQTVFPRLSSLYPQNPEGVRSLIRSFHRASILVYLVMLPLLFFYAAPLVRLTCGKAYPESIISFRILLVATLIVASQAMPLQAFLIYGQSASFARINIIYGLIGPIPTLAAIYFFSYRGAAGSLVVMALVAAFLILREQQRAPNQKTGA